LSLTSFNVEQYKKGNILGEDGYHLTEEGGKKIADFIAAATEQMTTTKKPTTRYTNKTTMNPNQNAETRQTTQSMTIPPGIGRHVIGKQGKTITELKTRNKVEIQTDQPNQDDETILKIKGKKEKINTAIEDIKRIIEEHLERQR
jgi:polyribonucleotide nucleotidyltransferase